jgi:hypothetical protein
MPPLSRDHFPFPRIVYKSDFLQMRRRARHSKMLHEHQLAAHARRLLRAVHRGE